MMDTLTTAGNFVVDCNHGGGHALETEWWPWILQFLVDHSAGITPDPYANALPSGFPSYCSIVAGSGS